MDITLLIALFGAVVIGAGCVTLGAWMSFRIRRIPGEGSGFVKDSKGQAFTIPDAGAMDFPTQSGQDEPDQAEKNVLQRAEKFLGSFNNNG